MVQFARAIVILQPTVITEDDAKDLLPTADGRELTLSRYTQHDADQRMLLEHLQLILPGQSTPKITAAQVKQTTEGVTV